MASRHNIAVGKSRKQPKSSGKPEGKCETGEVWKTFTFDYSEIGYLVTEKGNIDRPAALIDCSRGNSAHGYRVACAISKHFLNEPWRAVNREDDVQIIDLTSYGQPDSIKPMPAVVYGLQCSPVDSKGEAKDGPSLEPRPWCRFLFADLERRRPAQVTAENSPSTISEQASERFSVFDLLDQLSDITLRTKDYLGISHELTRSFTYWSSSEEDGSHKNIEMIKDAVEKFAELPSSMREGIYNGWNVATCPRPREELTSLINDYYTPIRRGLRLGFVDNHTFNASFEYIFDDAYYQDLHVFIREGARLEEALSALKAIELQIRENWARLIVDPERKAVRK